MTVLDYIDIHAKAMPGKIALTTKDGDISYRELAMRMRDNDRSLPIPLLGDAWDGDFVLYTTGSTGKPKGVIISQRAVIANSENLIEGHGYSADTFFIIAGAMDHLGCWSKIFPTLMAGGTLCVLRDGMKSISDFFTAADSAVRYGSPKVATFLVPSNVRILMSQAADLLRSHADSIDFIESGGAPLAQSDMQRMCNLLPHTRLYNTYASTETGVMTTYNYNDGRCISGCLGKPLKHSHVFITERGTIACKGDTLMSGYKNNPELTAEIMSDDTIFTADNGFIDSEGMLHIEGRTDDIINTGGFKVAPPEVEEAALCHESVDDCICISRPHPILGEALELLVIVKEGHTLDKRQLAQHLANRLEKYKVPIYYKEVLSIERTSNGKLNRKTYRS